MSDLACSDGRITGMHACEEADVRAARSSGERRRRRLKRKQGACRQAKQMCGPD